MKNLFIEIDLILNHNNGLIHNFYIDKLKKVDKNEFIKYKFKYLKNYIIPNINTIKINEKYDLLNKFIKIQNIIHKLYLLKNIVKKKTMKKNEINTDLNFDPLDNIDKKYLINFNDNQVEYIFKITDIINITEIFQYPKHCT